MDKEFLKRWKEAYVKMLKDARKAVFQEEQIYARPYITEDTFNPTIVRRFFIKLIDKAIFRLDDERIRKSQETLVEYKLRDVNIVNNLIIKIGRNNHEKSDLYKGLYFLYNAIDIMSSSAALADGVKRLSVERCERPPDE